MVALEASFNVVPVAGGSKVGPWHDAHPPILVGKVELSRHGNLTVIDGDVAVVGGFSNQDFIFLHAPIFWLSGERIELVAALCHPAVVVDSSEADLGVCPPVTRAPLALCAAPFETGRAHGSLDSSILDLCINKCGKVLNLFQRNLSVDTFTSSDHPFRLIEQLYSVDLVSVLLEQVKQWL